MNEAVETRRATDDQPEHALLERARSGDTAAFAALARCHQAHLLRVTARLVPTPEDAEDIVQDALVAAWEQLGRFRGDSSLRTWLTRIALHKAMKLMRRRGVEDTFASTPPGPPAPDPELAEVLAVRAAVAHLPLKLRAPVVLRFWEGMSGAEIAQVLGWRQGTVWTRLYHGIELLRRDLTEEDER